MKNTGVIPSLDGIRAISIILVFLSHAGLGHMVPGGLGVTIFFFLSGFLITTLLIEEYSQTKTINLKGFYIRRVLRLSPPLLVTLFLAYSLAALNVIPGGVSFNGFFAQVFYLANYHQILMWPGDTPEGLEILWSLAVEEHFYIIFPLLALLLFKMNNRWRLLFVLISLCFLALAWRYYLVLELSAGQSRTYYASDTRLDSILLGSIFAIIRAPHKDKELNIFHFKHLAIFGGGLLLLLVTLVYRAEVFRETLRYSLQGLAMFPIFYYVINCKSSLLFQWLENPFVKRLGLYSYSLYLSHLVIIRAIEYYQPTLGFTYKFPLAVLLSLVFAYLVERYIDSPVRVLRRRFR